MNFEPELKQTISNEWKDWLNTNISTNQDKDGLFKVLLMHGFSYDAKKRKCNMNHQSQLMNLLIPLM